jgi:fatty-acyl-CoA synthase
MDFVEKTINRVLNEISRKYPDRDALVHSELGVRYNYSLLSWEVNRVAKSLIGIGIRRGDRVALWAPNIPEWVITFLALAEIGAVAVPVDPGAQSDELLFILQQSECRAMLLTKGLPDDEYVQMALEARDQCPALEYLFLVADSSYPDTQLWSEVTARGDKIEDRALEENANRVRPADTVAIMYTSGTTGKPKGVVLDHLGLINKSICSTDRQGITHTDRLALFFPLFHMFGNTCIALAGLLKGASLVMPCRTFEPSKVLSAIYKEKCSAIYASPSMLIALLDHPEFKAKKWQTVKKGTIGGAPCPMELMKRVVDQVGVSDITVGYGITEASSWITMTHPEDPVEKRVSTIGTPLPANAVKIVDPATGEDLPPGRQGELCTKGFLMKGYYKMPAATSAAIDRDNWFHSGDLGEMDAHGYFKITGRLKDVIVREGVEIHPVELEEIIYRLPEVSEVQVFGFPHPQKGQEVAAWIKPKEASDLNLLDVAAELKKVLDPEKPVHYLKIVSEFPMTRSGKVQKYKLAEMAQEEYL